jgi:hypothetical protein
MPRTSATITPNEVAVYTNWCRANLVILSGNPHLMNNINASNENANLVADYFTKNWNMDITPVNLAAAMEKLRSYLKFYESPIYQEFDLATAGLSTEDQARFETWFTAQQNILVSEGPEGLQNMVVMLGVLRGRGLEIAKDNMNRALQNGYFAQNNGKRQPRDVFFRKIVQDYEVENERRRAEASQPGVYIGGNPIDKDREREEEARKQRKYMRELGVH